MECTDRARAEGNPRCDSHRSGFASDATSAPGSPAGLTGVRGAVAILGLLVVGATSRAHAQNLGTAANFAVLAGSTVTNTGPSVLIGDLGLSPGSSVTGFPPGIVTPPSTINIGNAPAALAQNNLITAYTALSSMSGTNLPGGIGKPSA